MKSNKELPTISLFTDIDSIFDTVFATLAREDDSEEYLDGLLKKGFYAREINEFDRYTYEEFLELYSKRDVGIFPYLIATSILDRLAEFTAKTYFNLLNSPFHAKPKIIVNTYPYVLSDEATRITVLGVKEITRSMADIEVVHIEPLEVTPSYIKKENIGMLILRDGVAWLEEQCRVGNFTDARMTDIELVCPLLFPGRPTNKETTLKEYGTLMKNLGYGLIQISFLNAYEFCLVPPKKT